MSSPLFNFPPISGFPIGPDGSRDKPDMPPRDPFLEQARLVDDLLTQAARHDEARKQYESALLQRRALLPAEADSRFFLKIMEPLCQFAGCTVSARWTDYQALLINAQQTLAHMLASRPDAPKPEPLPILKKCPPTRRLLHYMVRAAQNHQACSEETFQALIQPLQQFLHDPSAEHYALETQHIRAQLLLLSDALDRQEALTYVLPVAQAIAQGSADSPESWYRDMAQRARALFRSAWTSSRGATFLYVDYQEHLPEKHRLQFLHRDGTPYPGLFLFPAGQSHVTQAVILIPGSYN